MLKQKQKQKQKQNQNPYDPKKNVNNFAIKPNVNVPPNISTLSQVDFSLNVPAMQQKSIVPITRQQNQIVPITSQPNQMVPFTSKKQFNAEKQLKNYILKNRTKLIDASSTTPKMSKIQIENLMLPMQYLKRIKQLEQKQKTFQKQTGKKSILRLQNTKEEESEIQKLKEQYEQFKKEKQKQLNQSKQKINKLETEVNTKLSKPYTYNPMLNKKQKQKQKQNQNQNQKQNQNPYDPNKNVNNLDVIKIANRNAIKPNPRKPNTMKRKKQNVNVQQQLFQQKQPVQQKSIVPITSQPNQILILKKQYEQFKKEKQKQLNQSKQKINKLETEVNTKLSKPSQQELKKLRKRIQELQDALKSKSSESNVQRQRQFEQKQKRLLKELESLRSDMKTIKPIQGSAQGGKQILEKLNDWEKLKRSSEMRTEDYNKKIERRKAIDLLGKIEKKLNTGFIVDKLGRKDIITELQELYNNEILPYDEKEGLYQNYLKNFYLYSILTNFLKNRDYTERAVKKELLNPPNIEDYVIQHINGLNSIPTEEVIQDRFSYLIELNNIKTLDKLSDNLRNYLEKYINLGTTIRENSQQQIINTNESVASFIRTNNINFDGIYVTPEAKITLFLKLCLLKRNYPQVYSSINITTFLRNSLINLCFSLYGNNSISDLEKEIRKNILDIERQKIIEKIQYDASKDVDNDNVLFKELKSKLMLIEYELISDKSKRSEGYKGVIMEGIEQKIKKELVAIKKGFMGFSILSKTKFNKPIQLSNDQQKLKLYKDNLIYQIQSKKQPVKEKQQQIKKAQDIEYLKNLETNMKAIDFLKKYVIPYIDQSKLNQIPLMNITAEYIDDHIPEMKSKTKQQKQQLLKEYFKNLFNNVQQKPGAIIDLLNIASVKKEFLPFIVDKVNSGKSPSEKLKLFTEQSMNKMLSQTISKNQVYEKSVKGISLKPVSNKQFIENYINNIADENGNDKSISILNLLTNVAINKTKELAKEGAPSMSSLLQKGEKITQQTMKNRLQMLQNMNREQSPSEKQKTSNDDIVSIEQHPEFKRIKKLYKMNKNEGMLQNKLSMNPIEGYTTQQLKNIIINGNNTKDVKYKVSQNGKYQLFTPSIPTIPITEHPKFGTFAKLLKMTGNEDIVKNKISMAGFNQNQVMNMIKTKAKFKKITKKDKDKDGNSQDDYVLIQESKNQLGNPQQTNKDVSKKQVGGGSVTKPPDLTNQLLKRKKQQAGGVTKGTGGGFGFLDAIKNNNKTTK
jgi:hypothetical protein